MFRTNFTVAKRNAILLYKKLLERKQNLTTEKSVQNETKGNFVSKISQFFHRHSFGSSPVFENSSDDGKWPLGVFNTARVQSMFVTREESNLSRFDFERITKQNCLDFETKRNSSLRKLTQNETKTK